MSGTLSSLFQGQPIPPQPTGSDTSSNYPLWLQQYVNNLGNAATNLAGSDYTQFPGPQVAAPSVYTQQAQQRAAMDQNSWVPTASAAQSWTAQSAAPTNVGALSSSDINQYLNPYTSNVVGALQTASNKNLQDNQLPMLASQFVSAGQSRSPQEMQAANNAVYQSNQALDQATSQALQSGYNGAVTTAGQQQGLQLQQGQANRAAMQTAGAQMGALSQQAQQQQGYDVGQLAAAGQSQDTNNQANINAAMNNFYSQQQWPYQNLAFASNIIRGQPVASNTQTVGLTPSSQNSYTSSPLSAFIGGTLGGTALANGTSGTTGQKNIFGLKAGGRVSNDNKQGALSWAA